ncbi:hypothetical protein GRS48_06490 [Halorubrum sp. JWXQ-INN 858]|uniref:DUF7289 family protein n=1 Tax=Halorubrum sp. JWXQ-INN 858 TaxID=2690782 RepID=UPI0013599FF1|nr:hypothetical protein [Halorubrum sp. JWXQ-INN 858]MWV64472.1 hypothetical protein [Halorubrum sp. JWXQ-INN 858]
MSRDGGGVPASRRDAGAPGRAGSDARAVSDVVGYVLVFAIVTATIGTVFAVGMVGLEERQSVERVQNVERAFDVLDDNLRDLQRYEDPSRATEIRLGGGTLSLADETTVTVGQVGADGEWETDADGSELAVERRIHAVTYTSGDTEIAYEMGAWFRTDGETARMRSSPRFVAADGRTTLPIVRTRPDGDRTATSGDGTVQVSATAGPSPRYAYPASGTDPEAVQVRIESPRAEAWARYLEDTDGFVDVDVADGEVVATVEEDETVYVRVIAIDVAIRR